MILTRKGPFYLVLTHSGLTKQKYRQTLSDRPPSPLLFSRFLLISVLFIGLPCYSAAQQVVPTASETTQVPESLRVAPAANSSSLQSVVTYSARDSMFMDLVGQKVYLYDSATMDYEDVSLRAQYIEIDFKNSVVTAEGPKDSLGNYTGKAWIDQGGQVFEGHRLQYNIQTGKGKVSDVNTEQGGGYLLAEAVKKDSSGVVYGYRGQFTTCDLPHPHFALRAKKMKIIPDEPERGQSGKIVTGPAYLEISDVPTPLGIPFGYFPNKKGRKSGILIPTYGESPNLGFFLKDGGYYFGISDKIDLALRGDIYSRGSWGAKAYTNYRVRYKYSGQAAVKFSRILVGDRELPTGQIRNDFFVNWTHTQDPKFNPSIRFSANVNAGTSTYNTFNANIPNDYLSNTFTSNVSMAKIWKFGSLSANLRHNQNRVTRNVDLTLPQVAFTVNRFYPFRNPKRITSKWYDKVGMSYTSEFQNNLSVGDSMLSFRQFEYLTKRMRNGVRQTLPVQTSFNVLRFFTLTPSLTLNSITQFRTIRKTWNDTLGEAVVDTVNGARMSFDGSASMTLSTRIYGTFRVKRGRFTVMRHTMTPNITATYMPDFTDPKFGIYKDVQTAAGSSTKYSIFEGGVYGSPPAGKIGSIGVSLLNNLEAKKRPRPEDSSDVVQRVSLIDAFNLSMSYNFMADHFNWSLINAGFRTKLFRIIDINANAQADPYRTDSEGRRIERFEWRQGKRLARLTAGGVAIGTSLRPGGFGAATDRNSGRGTQAELEMINSNPQGYVDFNIPWSLNLSYNFSWTKPGVEATIAQSIRFSGDVNVTPKWKVGFDSNYDLQLKEFGYTSLNIYRDLHCWELQFNWVPFGFRQSYSVTLNVKSAVLQDLRLSRKRDWFDFTQ